MTALDPNRFRADLPPDMDDSQAEPLLNLAARLSSASPIPNPSFRGDLRRRLFRAPSRRLSGLRLSRRTAQSLALTYVVSGAVLLAVAALGLAGSGPFAPGA
jgi:hypothetical protein